MKHICNMTVPEVKQAFDKWLEKHCTSEKFEMGGLQLARYAELLEKANREELLNFISDIFNHGFMAGYKQSEADQKAKIDKRIKDESHHKLLELVYYLPFGYKAEYFYCMMSYLLPEDCLYLIPNRISKPMLAIREERKDRMAKESEPKPGQTAEERQAGEYRCNILRMIYDIENLEILNYINIIVSDVAKEDTHKTPVETDRWRIVELIAKIDDVWILDQIQRCTINIAK